jgi:hypothetical protein
MTPYSGHGLPLAPHQVGCLGIELNGIALVFFWRVELGGFPARLPVIIQSFQQFFLIQQ